MVLAARATLLPDRLPRLGSLVGRLREGVASSDRRRGGEELSGRRFEGRSADKGGVLSEKDSGGVWRGCLTNQANREAFERPRGSGPTRSFSGGRGGLEVRPTSGSAFESGQFSILGGDRIQVENPLAGHQGVFLHEFWELLRNFPAPLTRISLSSKEQVKQRRKPAAGQIGLFTPYFSEHARRTEATNQADDWSSTTRSYLTYDPANSKLPRP